MKPYFETELGKLYQGDCTEILSELTADVLITDPVWPNSSPQLPNHDRPYEVLEQALRQVNGSTKRISIQLGCDSDPRFLLAVPERFEFFRIVYLRFIAPGYKGRLLVTSDIAYLFGPPPRSQPGKHLIPGYYEDTSADGKQAKNHPCPRKKTHVGWQINWWTEKDEIVIDPFMGSGTTAVMCEMYQRKWIGIEISELFCEEAARRIEAESKQLKLFR